MSLSLTNRDDIIANSLPILTATGEVVDVLDAVQGSVVGRPPSTLNTLEQISSAISNDPNYFQTIQTAINSKAPASTTYNKTAVDVALALKSDKITTYNMTQINTFLDTKPDDSELEASVASVNTAIELKQNKFLLGEISSNTGRLFNSGITKFRSVHCITPLQLQKLVMCI